ncbi:hypothetical protein [Streptomyces bobili]|uniref:hypothetical protein n=1 Tax=Streptomyces bobili TaxID=67280 RepID=UPI0031342867
MSTAHDFDFLHGEWQGRHRRRSGFLDPGSDWEPEFPSTSHCLPVFDGAANLDEIDMPHLGSKGLTLRLFDPSTRQRSLHWSSSGTGRLFPPVVGRFTGGRGEFHGEDTFPHSPLRSSGGPPSARMCVGVSYGRECRRRRPAGSRRSPPTAGTWVTNWIMDFTRPPTPPPACGTP